MTDSTNSIMSEIRSSIIQHHHPALLYVCTRRFHAMRVRRLILALSMIGVIATGSGFASKGGPVYDANGNIRWYGPLPGEENTTTVTGRPRQAGDPTLDQTCVLTAVARSPEAGRALGQNLTNCAAELGGILTTVTVYEELGAGYEPRGSASKLCEDNKNCVASKALNCTQGNRMLVVATSALLDDRTTYHPNPVTQYASSSCKISE